MPPLYWKAAGKLTGYSRIQSQYLDKRNTVLKLSIGEKIPISLRKNHTLAKILIAAVFGLFSGMPLGYRGSTLVLTVFLRSLNDWVV
jgi:hypothetical protein